MFCRAGACLPPSSSAIVSSVDEWVLIAFKKASLFEVLVLKEN